jgi:hypothetical protein
MAEEGRMPVRLGSALVAGAAGLAVERIADASIPHLNGASPGCFASRAAFLDIGCAAAR